MPISSEFFSPRCIDQQRRGSALAQRDTLHKSKKKKSFFFLFFQENNVNDVYQAFAFYVPPFSKMCVHEGHIHLTTFLFSFLPI